MEYIGAADYYFWEGVKKGLGRSINLVEEEVAQLSIFGNNDTSWACYEAFGWGYCLGTTLTQEEYRDLTTVSFPIKVKAKDKETGLEEMVNINIEGNC